MRRRTYLRGLAVLSTGLAGCAARAPRATSQQTPERSSGPQTVAGQELPVPETQLQRAVPRDGIRAITDPVFGTDWAGISFEAMGPQGFVRTVEPRLSPGDRVVGVERDGAARAYPLSVFRWHEVVNDSFGGPLLVTYCPLCRSTVTAERRVDSEETTFGVSGLLWRENLVLYDDRTDSKWSQLAATAIRGPMTGAELSLVPSTLTTWAAWQEDHPDTRVLRPPPESKTVGNTVPRDYTLNGYQWYADRDTIGVDGEFEDDRLHPKTLVVGVEHDGQARAYPFERVAETGVVNDTIGSLPVVVTIDSEDSLHAYVRRVDGSVLSFSRSDGRLAGGGSRWHPRTGRALDGPHEGTRLDSAASLPPLYWFAWAKHNPDTDLYQ